LLLRAGGWTPVAEWTDQKEFFSLILREGRNGSIGALGAQ